MAEQKLTDNDQMPSGAHQGKRMADVPAEYLVWIYENNRCTAIVKAYIKENEDVIYKQAGKKPPKPKGPFRDTPVRSRFRG